MKQRITIEQLKELTSEQQEKLIEWWKPENGDYFTYDMFTKSFITEYFPEEEYLIFCHQTEYYKNDCLPLLSIGQCIEFLMEQNDIEIDPDYIDFNWSVNGHKELIDGLWAVVKTYL